MGNSLPERSSTLQRLSEKSSSGLKAMPAIENKVTGSNYASSSSLPQWKNCRCGERVIVMPLRTSKNPMQRFLRCPNWMSPFSCNYFEWVDEGQLVHQATDVAEIVAEIVKALVEEFKWKNLLLQEKLDAERRLGSFKTVVIILSWMVILFGVMNIW